MPTYSIVVPTYNGGKVWVDSLSQIKKQEAVPKEVLVVDSSSTDRTASLAKENNLKVIEISVRDFNHGKTRQLALDKIQHVDVVVFITQDAVIEDKNTITKLLEVFTDVDIGAVYGKQIPKINATVFEQYEREFTYSNNSKIYSMEDRSNYGMKVCFLSNAFTAYRMDALREVSGFPDNTIVSEDMYVGAKMLKAGWKLAYCHKAAVVHSHSYNLRELFGRYFDIGVFNSRESWIREEFGAAEGEGLKYVKSELRFLLKRAPWLIPYALVRTSIKFLGFKTGLNEKYLPNSFKKIVSRQKNYWS